MYLQPRTREEVAHHAMSILSEQGETFVHESGPHKGKPLSQRRINAMVSDYIREQKRRGKLVERRPYVEATSNKRGVQFLVVPQTLDLFE